LLTDPETKRSKLVASDRVFASASLEAQPISILMMMDKSIGVNCPPPYIGN
jgi:hypothetical protein